MKRKKITGVMLAFVGVFALTVFSCDGFSFKNDEKMVIRLSFFQNEVSLMTKGESLKELPDTNDFILDIRSGDGEVIYKGLYGERPEKIEVTKGDYIVKVLSSELSMPRFSLPVYGDNKEVIVDKDDISIKLVCKQVNAGIKINFSDNYKNRYSKGKSILRSDEGELEYGLQEDRIAFFSPGEVSLLYAESSNETSLLRRTISSGEMMTFNIDCSKEGSNGADGVSITIDSTRIWLNEDIFLGRDRDGSTQERAFKVGDVKDNIDLAEVWICGYVVGGDLSQKEVNTEPPFTSKSNLAIADHSNETERENMVSVELSATKIKEALNLVDNEDLFGQKIYIKGNIVESYFGLNGVKAVKEYHIEE